MMGHLNVFKNFPIWNAKNNMFLRKNQLMYKLDKLKRKRLSHI